MSANSDVSSSINASDEEYQLDGLGDVSPSEPIDIKDAVVDEQEETATKQQSKSKKSTKQQSKPKAEKSKADKPKTEKKAQKPKADKQQTQPRKNKQEFSSRLLTHLMNTFYDDYKFKDISQLKEGKGGKQLIIDVHDYKALDELKKAIIDYDENANRTEKKEKEAERWTTITHAIWNFKLRGILTAINDNEVKKELDDGTSLFMDHIVSQLEFNDIEQFNAKGVIGEISEFFTSDRFKFKLYNAMFPHPSLSTTATKGNGGHLNKAYLQNISNYHDYYLDQLYAGKVSAASDLFKYACEKIASDDVIDKSITADRLFTTDYSDKAAFTKEERNSLSEVIRKVKFEKNVSDRYFKCYNLAIEQKLIDAKTAQKQYKQYIKILKQFKSLADELQKADIGTKEKFINVFINAYRKADEFIHYKVSIKNFIKDINCQQKLMFSQKFKQALTHIITDDKTFAIKYVGDTFVATYTKGDDKKITIRGDIIQTTRHTSKSVYETLAKIGLICGNDIKKEIRIGVGISVVDYIINKAKIIASGGKSKQRKIIYIKA